MTLTLLESGQGVVRLLVQLKKYVSASRKRHQHLNVHVLEPDHGIVKPEVLCCVHKLHETWNGKRELLEELNSQDRRRSSSRR
jgi:hypothetical protein